MPDSFGMSFGKSLANSAGSGIVSGLINQGFGAWTAARDYKYWKKRTDYENKLQKEWFDLTNEYNSPEAQRARLEKAGLSPALMYGGSGAGASFGASAADMPNAPSGGGAAPSGTMNSSYDALSASVIQLNQAKADESRANAEDTRGETVPAHDLQALRTSEINANQARMAFLQKQAQTEEEKKNNLILDNYARQRQNRIGDATEQVEISKAYADYDNIVKQNDMLAEQIDDKKFWNSMHEWQKKAFIAEYNNTLIEGVMKKAQIALANVGIHRSMAEINYICTQDDKARQEIQNLITEQGLTLEKANTEKEMRPYMKWKAVVGMVTDTANSVASLVNAFKPPLPSSGSTGPKSSLWVPGSLSGKNPAGQNESWILR